MPIKETLTAKPVTLAEVLSNGRRYIVPPFQRDYAWEAPQWQELWDDIMLLATAGEHEEASHYLGAIVLQPVDGARQIVDGQQRLVTLSVLALAVIGRIQALADEGIEPDDNLDRVKILSERFVRSKSARSLQYVPRLELNRHDDPFYRTYLVQGHTRRRTGLGGSHQRLSDARDFFAKRLAEYLGDSPSGSELATFLESTVAERLRFIQIEVEDDETAFTVFETLNARGVALGTADLLKNYLFQVASRGGSEDLRSAHMLWNETTELVPLDDLSTMYFYKLSDRVPDLREKRVFAEVKRIVPGRSDVFAFMNEMRDTAEYYAALDDPTSPLWHDFPGIRPEIERLALLRVRQSRPLVLAAIDAFGDRPDKLVKLLRRLVSISVRAWVARVNTGTLQRAYQTAALQVARGNARSPRAIAAVLSPVLVTDEAFQAAFSTLEINPKGSRKRTLRYLLSQLEAAAGGAVIDFDGSDATVEHILPENPNGPWPEFTAEEHRANVNRLGNLAPLEYSINRALGAASFEAKRDAYQRSAFVLARQVVATDWTPRAIRSRQEQLASLAVQVWSLGDPPEA